jgi:hypothetical protein
MDPAARTAPPGFLPRLAAPPRQVPLGLHVRLLFGGRGVFAWLWFALSSGLSIGFIGNADLSSWLVFRGPLETVEGTSTGCEDTGASEGGTKHRRATPIYVNRYTFEAGGRTREGASYSPGACMPEGHAVVVQHPAGRPEVSRIAGMRRAIFGPWVAFLAIFPLVGLVLVGLSLAHGRRQLRLLEQGRLGLGKLVSIEATNVSVNRRKVMKLRFELTSDAGTRHDVIIKTSLPGRLEDEPQERILYDPATPERAFAWDLLDPSPRLDPSGHLESPGLLGAALVLLPPLAAIAAIGAALALS